MFSQEDVVARINAHLANKSCSSSLNGSNLEQMSYNRDGRLPLEVVEIWNESLWWSGVAISYGDGSSWSHLHNHTKQANKIKKHQNIIHNYMSVTKESNNKIHDYNINTLWKRKQLCIKDEEEFYNLFFSVDVILHMPMHYPQKLQLAPSILTLLN